MADAPLSRTVWGKDVHSIFLTVLPEAGLLGTLIFLWLILRQFRLHARIRRNLKEREDQCAGSSPDEEGRLMLTASLGLSGALVAYLATGAFLSAFYYPHFWNLLALSLALEMMWHARRRSETTPDTGEETP
jgi:O-antigen ligase